MAWKITRRDCIKLAAASPLLASMVGLPLSISPESGRSMTGGLPEVAKTIEQLKSGWNWPSRTFRPRVFWFWPGNDVTKDGITWHLKEMRKQGIGGVKIISAWNMYVKGNIPYMSEEYLEMARHTVQTGEQLDMEVSFYFTPGWGFGGFWVPPMDRSKMLLPAWVDVNGPVTFNEALPTYKMFPGEHVWPMLDASFVSSAADENRLIAVVAAKVIGDKLDGTSLTDLTLQVTNNRLKWMVPPGRWRILVCRLKYTGQLASAQNYKPDNWVVDHFNKGAMQRYCNWLGATLYRVCGSEFGKTIESLHSDSWEVKYFPRSILWSTDTLELFRRYHGYDFTPYLPAIWWDIGELTPKVRYDINRFMHWLTIEAFMKTFINWCTDHGVQASLQPHDDIPTEHIEAAGLAPRSETEITIAGFEVATFPRKDAAAGVRFYGREFLQAEAFTWIHPQRFRARLEELKIAADGFLRDGVTQFYTHNSMYTPEMQIEPSRYIPWAVVATHGNTWWNYYNQVADYISRACFMLRQGVFVGDVLLYSPQSTVWTQKVLGNTDWRTMPYGELGKTLVANGYDFDPVNDDVLQHRARIEQGTIRIREVSYRVVILPNIQAIPLPTIEFLQEFVRAGGIVIALSSLPDASVGLASWTHRDHLARTIVADLFGPDGAGHQFPRGGHTYYLPDYDIGHFDLHPSNQPVFKQAPPLVGARAALIDILRRYIGADVAINGGQQSTGLMFLHRRVEGMDIYFLTNLQTRDSKATLTFRVTEKVPQLWEPIAGTIRPIHVYRMGKAGIDISLNLASLASAFVIFVPQTEESAHITETNLAEVRDVSDCCVTGIASRNGKFTAEILANGKTRTVTSSVSGLPGPFVVSGKWRMMLQGYMFARYEQELVQLASWTDDARTKHFSGTGRYDIDITLPPAYLDESLELLLDLGSVGDIAEVLLNGFKVGVRWMRPFQIDITGTLKSRTNHLTILVTNTLINRVSAMDKPTEVPAEMVPHYGPTPNWQQSPDPAVRDNTTYCRDWRVCGTILAQQEFGYAPLPPSGLLGPVQIIPRRKVLLRV